MLTIPEIFSGGSEPPLIHIPIMKIECFDAETINALCELEEEIRNAHAVSQVEVTQTSVSLDLFVWLREEYPKETVRGIALQLNTAVCACFNQMPTVDLYIHPVPVHMI